ncbi:hypothetical protein GGR56DRAFT_661099 [Xylariaceae sp. FL0804]|nr:hypothetical protein GGR56DRAFT_661099 [Xylariaceae sp. FL0804]
MSARSTPSLHRPDWRDTNPATVKGGKMAEEEDHTQDIPDAIRQRQSPTSTIPTAIPLTTTYIPPDTCNQGLLTILSSPGYQIWLNEPIPVPSSTFSSCYPPEFLQFYRTYHIDATTVGSLVPMMSPLVCPLGWTYVMQSSDYRACCPTNYDLHAPDTTLDSNRPAYGGTCFSQWSLGQSSMVTGYGPSSYTGIVLASASTTPYQAFAHVIDGIVVSSNGPSQTAGDSPSASSEAFSTNWPSTTVGNSPSVGSETTTPPSSSSSRLSNGSIVGIAIAALAAVIIIVVAGFLILGRRRRQQAQQQPHQDFFPAPPPPPPKEYAGTVSSPDQISPSVLSTKPTTELDAGEHYIPELGDGTLPPELR